MRKINFNVSARTARLIGRENVSNPSGALIELIKNCHDADSSEVILIFNIRYDSIPRNIFRDEFTELAKDHDDIKKFYEKKSSDNYELKEIDATAETELGQIFKGYNSIYLCDNGHGMDSSTIENCWMTIGTDNKLENPKTADGRIKSGAKGIGRFALDRLGTHCELTTFTKVKNKSGLSWIVNWEDFEVPNKKISEISAELHDIKGQSYADLMKKKVFTVFSLKNIDKTKYINGTIIQISQLRDWWTPKEVQGVFSGLESLIPPNFHRKFKVIFHDTREPEAYGLIRNGDVDDFDYKIEAKYSNKQKIKIKLYRNEFDYKKFPKEFFSLKSLEKGHYKKKDFEAEYIDLEYSVHELLGSSNIDDSAFKKVGPFDMTFLFMKRGFGKPDQKKFFYKEIDSSTRKERLALYGGIKIFRDNFKVRPYGEVNGNSFDWLGLGERVTLSPAGPTHLSGRWRVRSAQVLGSLNISRIDNEFFEDKSSREGLQENETFTTFKNLVIGIIDKFEHDRQTIMRALNSLYTEQDELEKKIIEGDKVLEILKKSKKSSGDKKGEKKTDQETIIDAYIAQKEQIKELIDENKLLVGLASTGLTISAFSHELKNIKSSLNLKTDNLEKYIHASIDQKKAKSLEEFKDPRVLVKQFQSINKRINNWLTFTLECVKQDKRKRKKLSFDSYFKNLSNLWSESFIRLQINLNFKKESSGDIYKRMFELDLDSVFNNLIVNSVSAFEDRKDGKIERNINIKYGVEKDHVCIVYSDSGPGLDPAIKEKEQVFEPHFTTKKTSTGEVIGTGMGMWIIQKSIREYKGNIEILDTKEGFSVKIKLPIEL